MPDRPPGVEPDAGQAALHLARQIASLAADLHELAARHASPELDLAARLAELALQRRSQETDFQRHWASLPPRQRLALELARRGLSYKQIAYAWGVQPGTVRTHTSRALRNLGLPTRSDWLALHPPLPQSPLPSGEGRE